MKERVDAASASGRQVEVHPRSGLCRHSGISRPDSPHHSELEKTRKGRAGHKLAAILLALCFVALAGAEALGSNFGSIIYASSINSGAWLANNRTHKVDLHNTTDAVGAAIKWAMDNALGETTINPVLVDGNDYDVRVLDGGYDTWTVAWVSCPPEAQKSGSHPNMVCRGQRLRVNLPHISNYTVKQRRSMACHELGHTVSLRHVAINDAETCMRGNVIDRPTTYRYHDKQMLLDHYG